MGAGAQWGDYSQQENKAPIQKEDTKLIFCNLGTQKLRRNIIALTKTSEGRYIQGKSSCYNNNKQT